MFCYGCKGVKCAQCVAAKQLIKDSTRPLEDKMLFAIHTGLTVQYLFDIIDTVATPLRNGKFMLTIFGKNECLNYYKSVTSDQAMKLLVLRGKQKLNLTFWRL